MIIIDEAHNLADAAASAAAAAVGGAQLAAAAADLAAYLARFTGRVSEESVCVIERGGSAGHPGDPARHCIFQSVIRWAFAACQRLST